MRLLVPPPVVALAAAIGQRMIGGAPPARSSGQTLAAASLTVGSASLAGAAAASFVKSGTTVEPFRPEEASTLVTSGANAITRNPMYVGMAGLLLAHAVWRSSWAGLAPAAAFVAIIDRLQIEAEESALLEKFGVEYESYRVATPRWLGLGSLPARLRSS